MGRQYEFLDMGTLWGHFNFSIFIDTGRLGLDSEEDHYTPQKVGLWLLLKICKGINPN